jgi:hypothetical protein
MMTVVSSIRVLVSRRLVMSDIVSRSRVMSNSGMSANGMPKDRTIWEKTKAWLVFTASARMISEGSIVRVRRTSRGMRQFMKPAMTIWPAQVPTLEDDRRGAAANQVVELRMDEAKVADGGHSRPVKQRRGDAEHGEVDKSGNSEADYTVPLVVIQECLALPVVGGLDPVLLQRRVQVNNVRHDGCTDDPDGQAQGARTSKVRHETGSDLPGVLTADGEEHIEETQTDQSQERDDSQLEAAVAALLEGEDHEGNHRGDEPRREERYAEDEVQADSGAHELG